MNKIKKYYFQPSSYVYLFIEATLIHKVQISILIGLLIISYPVYDIFHNIKYQQKQFDTFQKYKENDLSLDKKLKKLKVVSIDNHSPLEINQKVKRILVKNKMNVESILWNKENNIIDVVFNQKFKNVVDVIIQISNTKNIYFNEINLIKINKNNLVQCVLSLSILER
ncbi:MULTISPECIES: hypothetical protein [Pasteurellaceae]|uniref:Uncharacterized protein n=1 Tax=Pasteurella atlantica TaxID=2827233 RepID=A0AAW8CJJ2_9PAST|nr:hypothetical protein [Pasteurella atlantica]MBR0574294.1 hypothetical protein [Pasteurella atlantica]MDP8040198.1 hypothetical protein [Pasteurella atlantica]MDP8042279.1 hypothetical protein [Pasteurella atlantica]MDP8044504.1 hypothetical protein [Pasteurella atlantica]MDP8046484.1 hypothetical protein [Pasteurella atlantica]